MSSFNVGLGSWKKGGRVADSSMLTRNVKLVAAERGVANELSTLTLGNLGIPSQYRIPSAETIQTVYKDTTPAMIGAFNSAAQIRRRTRQ
uniref:Uncharacterized protein n=1 Tax=viral metagenome TaxID=1070528 RepID=A0A6C0CI39_9ZZZZ